MNRLAIKRAAQRRSGVDLTDDAWNDIVQEATYEFGHEAAWPWLRMPTAFATVADDGDYELANLGLWSGDVEAVESVVLDGLSFVPCGYDEIARWDDGAPTRGRGYSVFGGKLFLRPTPSTTGDEVEVVLVLAETTYADDTESPVAPVSTHLAIVELCMSMAHDRQGNLARADHHRARYERSVQKFKKSALMRPQGRVGSIRIREGSGL